MREDVENKTVYALNNANFAFYGDNPSMIKWCNKELKIYDFNDFSNCSVVEDEYESFIMFSPFYWDSEILEEVEYTYADGNKVTALKYNEVICDDIMFVPAIGWLPYDSSKASRGLFGDCFGIQDQYFCACMPPAKNEEFYLYSVVDGDGVEIYHNEANEPSVNGLVDVLNSETESTEIYDLHGRRIPEPMHGINIMRKGFEVSKIFVR